jgi:hypothetical protein
MYIEEILLSLSLSFSIGCVWFLSRSFLVIGESYLQLLGAGAIAEDASRLFGSRWELVEAVIRQKAEVIYGLLLFLCASVSNFVSVFRLLKPDNLTVCILLVVAISMVIVFIGHLIVVPFLYYLFFVKAALKSLSWHKELLKLNKEEFEKNLRRQLGCYHLGHHYEKKAMEALEKYRISRNKLDEQK